MHAHPTSVAGSHTTLRRAAGRLPRPARRRSHTARPGRTARSTVARSAVARSAVARPALARHERAALAVVGFAVAGFAAHGLANGVPGTLEYVVTVSALAALLVRLRTRVLPAPLVAAVAVSAVVHLAGGLVRVGDGVLYNATPGPELLRYDHLGHALGTFVGAQLVWELLVRDAGAAARRGALVAVTVLAALGLGALNEGIEFVATLVHGGSHVGGYTNTGWDLVTNTVAGLLAGLAIHRRLPHPTAPPS